MKERSKTILRDSFGSLINNDRALSAAKTCPIWLTIIMFVIGFLLPVIPITAYYGSQSGSSYVKSYSLGLKKTVPAFALTMYQKDENRLVVSEDKTLNINTNSSDPVYTYTNDVTGKQELRVYFSSAETKADKEAYLKMVSDFKEELTPADEENKKEATYSRPTFMIFYNDLFVLQLFQPGTDASGGYMSGNYKAFKPGDNIVNLLVTLKGEETIAKPASEATDKDIKTYVAANKEKCDEVFNNYKQFLNVSFKSNKESAVLKSTLIFAGIYLGLSLLMAFIIWLLTRGKNNPFNYYTLWLSFKTEAWIAISPALIGLIAGLLLPFDMSIKMMLFIAPLGFRLMFLMTKQLRPAQ